MKFSSLAILPTLRGRFKIQSVREDDGIEHIVIYQGELKGKEDVMVRIHSECLTSEVFGSRKCDCREQLETSLEMIDKAGEGAIIYLRQEGRGIGLFNKIEAYALQDRGYDTIEANVHLGFEVDLRTYDSAAEIIRYLGIRSIKILTNNPEKIESLELHGIKITGQIRVVSESNEFNIGYLETKKNRMNHIL
jgi:3,4-dihydroxy 2-butanone 4-phosphate synthase/GTP cyclohydrolase II